jgi:hypothetical protein
MASEGKGIRLNPLLTFTPSLRWSGHLGGQSLIGARPALAFCTYAGNQEAHQAYAPEWATIVCALFGTSTPQMAWTQVTK